MRPWAAAVASSAAPGPEQQASAWPAASRQEMRSLHRRLTPMQRQPALAWSQGTDRQQSDSALPPLTRCQAQRYRWLKSGTTPDHSEDGASQSPRAKVAVETPTAVRSSARLFERTHSAAVPQRLRFSPAWPSFVVVAEGPAQRPSRERRGLGHQFVEVAQSEQAVEVSFRPRLWTRPHP